VSAVTRERILAAAERLKYRPNRVVSAFKTGRTGLVGLMVRPSKLYRCDLIEGIHDTLVAAGSLPVMHFSHTGGEAAPDAAVVDRDSDDGDREDGDGDQADPHASHELDDREEDQE
jgi:DNA-binding LacI/PurR family transcriptional regulator